MVWRFLIYSSDLPNISTETELRLFPKMSCNLKSNMVFLPEAFSSIVMKIFGNSMQIRRHSSINYLEQKCTSLPLQLTLFHSIPVIFITAIKISAIKNPSFRKFDSQNPTVLKIFFRQSLPKVLEHLRYFCCSFSSLPLSPSKQCC